MNREWSAKELNHLSDSDIAAARNMAYSGCPVNDILVRYSLTKEQLDWILDGLVRPYAGGPLRALPLQGCNPRNQESTRNRQKFVRGVIKAAKELLSDEEFQVFANFNGLSVKDAKQYAHNSENSSERLAAERYRGVLGRHAQGASVEEAVIAHSQRARKGTTGA